MLIDKEKIKEIYSSNIIKFTDLIIILDTQCNADCKLCVAKHVIKNSLCKSNCYGFSSECRSCCSRTASDDLFLSEVDSILSFLNGSNVRLTISGGEPTLSSRLLQVLSIIDNYEFMEIAIETNGAKLLDKAIRNELIKRNVKVILSRYAIDDEVNKEIFGFKDNQVNNLDIESIAKYYQGSVEISSIPLKGAVDTASKLLEFYNFYKSLGIKKICFNEAMFDTTLSESNKEIANFYNENKIDISNLSSELVEKGVEKIIDKGSGFRYIVHRYGDSEIVLTSADMSKIATESKNSDKYSRYLIYPSGEIGANYIEDRL